MMPTFENNEGQEGDEAWGHHEEVPDSSETETHSSQDFRQMANSCYANRDFDSALPLYSMAIDTLVAEQDRDELSFQEGIDLMVVFLCNRSTCLYRMELFEDAKVDALEAVRLSEENNAKASFRLAKAQLALKQYTDAITTLYQAIKAEQKYDDPESKTIAELQKLLQTVHEQYLSSKHIPDAVQLSKATSIKTELRTPSIREFDIENELGEGNYSRVVAVRHTVTSEKFALKIIEKKKIESLGKRQHPNVYNEIEMEKRVLGQRLLKGCGVEDGGYGCSRIVHLYHTFQDYNNLYYLMDLYLDGGDMWSTLRYNEKMVGTHHSLAKLYLFELLDALEFIHSRGIVHRDLKAENLLLSSRGHLILIDFGTAKDLIYTEFNGPEFVGTPDFMSPESIKGTSGMDEAKEANERGVIGSDHSLDLWALGAVAYQLLTGATPFSSPSHYLSYLKIKRGLLCRPMGITDDDAWDFIERLMKVDPKQRLGADCFECVQGKDTELNHIVQKGNGYDTIRNHPYFAEFQSLERERDGEETTPIPSLCDLCIRACAELVQEDSMNLDIHKEHPPGDGSSHDMLRLNKRHRGQVMGFLDKLRVLSQPRVYRRFFSTKQDARLGKVRESTRDFVGLTQMNDKHYQFPMKDSENKDEERSDVLETIFPIRYMHVSNPLFDKKVSLNCSEEQRQSHIKDLKECLKKVNKTRPKIVVASGYLDADCRKLMGKVNESIPVALNDGAMFYSFWSNGGQGLVLRSSDFIGVDTETAQKCDQAAWLRQELEQIELTRHHCFAFIDCDPDDLPVWLIRILAKGRVLCLFGRHEDADPYEKEYSYNPMHKMQSTAFVEDDESVSSVESNIAEEEDDRIMKIIGRSDSSLCCFKLEEYGAWEFENIS